MLSRLRYYDWSFSNTAETALAVLLAVLVVLVAFA
jgi:hypothetical protein